MLNSFTARRRWLSAAGALAGAAVLLATVTAAPAAAQPGVSRGWVSVPLPAGSDPDVLAAVLPISPSQAWAVGSQGVVGGDDEQSLTLRWNGRTWREVASPGDAGLRAVDATGTADVWAVGGSADGTRSVIQHWDGTAWSEVDHVAAGADRPLGLGSVAALGPDDAWVVGYQGALEEGQPHAQHWDGTRWAEVPVPAPDGALVAVLSAVDGLASDDVWAVGFAFDPAVGFAPYVVHWDGSAWSLVDVPATVTGGLTDVHVAGPGELLAVGANASPVQPDPVPVIASLSGGQWRQEAPPVPGGELNGVSSDGRGGYWVVGDRVGTGHDDRQPLILRGNGSGRWSVQTSPVTDPGGLRDVQVTPGGTVAWAVGATGVTDETRDAIALRTR